MTSGHRVGEAVAHVEAGRMSRSLAVALEGIEGPVRILCRDRDKTDPGEVEQHLDIGSGRLEPALLLAGDAEDCLVDGNRRGDGGSRPFEASGEGASLRLLRDDGDESGGVDEHHSSFNPSKKALSASRPVDGRAATRSCRGLNRSHRPGRAGPVLVPLQLVTHGDLDGLGERNALPLGQKADEAVRLRVADMQGHGKLASSLCRKPTRMMSMPASQHARRASSQHS